jgi:hypothetical protein
MDNEIHNITKIIHVKNLALILEFDKREIRLVDLGEKFRSKSKSPNSKFRELLDAEMFGKVHLHPEWQTIYWDNGIDLDPNVLYDMSTPVQNDYPNAY